VALKSLLDTGYRCLGDLRWVPNRELMQFHYVGIKAEFELVSLPGRETRIYVRVAVTLGSLYYVIARKAGSKPTNPAPQIIRVLCVDDHPLVRKGIASILANEADLQLVGEAGDGREAVQAFRLHRPDVTLMDLRMPNMDGIQATRLIRRETPEARIIALTSYDGDQDIYRSLEAGVRGYLLKEMVHTEIVRAIRVIHSGKRLMPPEVAERLSEYSPQVTLTPREIEVLAFVARGLGNKEIGAQLGTAAGTVKMHLQNILCKLGASDRAHAVALAVRRGIIYLDR